MKFSKRMKEVLGLSLLISAISLTITFIVQAIRKKSIWQALLAIAAAEGAVGSALLLTRTHVANCADVAESKEDDGEELFDEEESEEAELRIRSVLGGKYDGEPAVAPSARREIPRDEDATEADFM